MIAWALTILAILAVLLVSSLMAGNPLPSGNDCSFAANNGNPLPAECSP